MSNSMPSFFSSWPVYFGVGGVLMDEERDRLDECRVITGLNLLESVFLLEELLGRRVEVVTIESLSPHIGPHILREAQYVALDTIIQETDLDTWKTYLTWMALNNTASRLTEELDKQNFEFYERTLSGVEQQREDWRRATGLEYLPANEFVIDHVGQSDDRHSVGV